MTLRAILLFGGLRMAGGHTGSFRMAACIHLRAEGWRSPA